MCELFSTIMTHP